MTDQQINNRDNLKYITQKQNSFTNNSTVSSSNASQVKSSPKSPNIIPIGVSANATLPRQQPHPLAKVQNPHIDTRSKLGAYSHGQQQSGSQSAINSDAESRRGSNSGSQGSGFPNSTTPSSEGTPEDLLMKLRLSLKTKQGSGVSTFSSSNTLIGAHSLPQSPASTPHFLNAPHLRNDIQAVARSRSHTLSSQNNSSNYPSHLTSNSTFGKSSFVGHPLQMTESEPSSRGSISTRSTRRGSNSSTHSSTNPISPTGKTLGFDFSHFNTNTISSRGSSSLTSPTSLKDMSSMLEAATVVPRTSIAKSPFDKYVPHISIPKNSAHTASTLSSASDPGKDRDPLSPTGTIVAQSVASNSDVRSKISAAPSPFMQSGSNTRFGFTSNTSSSSTSIPQTPPSALSKRRGSASTQSSEHLPILSRLAASGAGSSSNSTKSTPMTSPTSPPISTEQLYSQQQQYQSSLLVQSHLGASNVDVDEDVFDARLKKEYPNMVRCFPLKSDGLVRLNPGWDIEVFPDTRYNNLRRCLFEVFQQQRNHPLIIPPDLQALIQDDFSQE